MEEDIIIHQLMHNNYPKAYSRDLSRPLNCFPSIDGASAFYDIRFRRMAITMFAKYLYLPQL